MVNIYEQLELLDYEADNPCVHCACYPQIKLIIEQCRKELILKICVCEVDEKCGYCEKVNEVLNEPKK